MHFIALAVVLRALTPAGAKSAELQSISLNACAIATDVAQNIIDRFGLLNNHGFHESLSPEYM
jgi:hypothetical protein